MSRAADAQRDGMAPILDVTMERWFNDAVHRAKAATRRCARACSPNDIRAWCDAFNAMAHVDTAPRLNGIKVPTLCLAGEVDKSTPPPVVKAIADAIPGARFAVLPAAPHMPFVEMPQDVAKVVVGSSRRRCASRTHSFSISTRILPLSIRFTPST